MLKKNIRRGSYLVEATIIVPVFIMAVLLLISIIPIIATIENTCYIATDEMHLEQSKAIYSEKLSSYPLVLKHRIIKENPKVDSFKIIGFKYKFRQEEIDDLISVKYRVSFSEKNPFGFFSDVNFDGKLMSRAYTGALNSDKAKERNEFEEDRKSKVVYVFPNWGMKYHNDSCTYVKASCRMEFLSQSTKKKYRPCDVCKSVKASVGSPVFCFVRSGRVYHFGSCKVIDRYYVECEKEEAVKKGYTPCSKCGGD